MQDQSKQLNKVCLVEMEDTRWMCKGVFAAGNMVNGALAVLMKKRNVSTSARLAHNAVVVPTLSYGSETWILGKKNERKEMPWNW